MTQVRISIAAVSDIHSPRYLPLFVASINELKLRGIKVEIVILAGDIVEHNKLDGLEPVLVAVRKLESIHDKKPKIIAVFGNEEYMGYEHEYRKRYPEVVWLDDEYLIFSVNDKSLCIIGSRGVLMKPTTWQAKNIQNIELIFGERIVRIKKALEYCRENHDKTLLITHYATSFATLRGEEHRIYKFLGYPFIEFLEDYLRPHIAIHGHAHNATTTFVTMRNTVIYNVALPANKKVTIIDLEL